jgi:hypothetical protein
MSESAQSESAQFEDYIRSSFLRHGLAVERCARILFSQLAYMPAYRGLNFPFQFVEREIRHLEGLANTETKPAKPFNKSGKLSGFMHKHFCVPGYEHLAVNATLAWQLQKSGSRKFTEMALKIAKPYADVQQTPDQLLKFSGEIARAVVSGPGGLQERQSSGRATGDWIVFASHEGQNYYLCIAKHDEDDFILETLRLCTSQFPFVGKIIGESGDDTEPTE